MVTRTYQSQIQEQQQDPGTPAPAAPPTDNAPPAPSDPPSDLPAAPAPEPPRTGKVVTLQTSQMAKLKREERDKGRRAALAELDTTAKSLGYASHAAMIQALQANKGRPPARARPTTTDPEADTDDEDSTDPQTPPAANTAGRRRQTKSERELERAREQRRAANRARAAAEKKLRLIERQREADRAENELRVVAVGAGVTDVDYALALLQRELQGMTPEQLAKFDEQAYFKTELRKTRPYLYAAVDQPVTTSPSPTGTKPPDPPNKPPATPTDNKDARTMTKAEYEAHLRKKGYSLPALGTIG